MSKGKKEGGREGRRESKRKGRTEKENISQRRRAVFTEVTGEMKYQTLSHQEN